MVGHASFFCLWKCDYQHGLTCSGLHNLDITCSCCGLLLLNWRHLLQISLILAVRILTSEKCVIDNRDDLKNKLVIKEPRKYLPYGFIYKFTQNGFFFECI